MLATLGAPPAGDDFAVEWKFDGQRAQVVVAGGEVIVFSRNGADITATFPELSSVSSAVGGRSVAAAIAATVTVGGRAAAAATGDVV